MEAVLARPVRRKQSYKDRLDQQRLRYESTLASINPLLQEKFNSYASTLKGEHEYIDSHTGKTVHARTYKKRLEFAEDDLESIGNILKGQRHEGKISDSQVAEISAYVKSLYDIAITKNSYVKETNLRQRAVAVRVRKHIHSLDDLVSTDNAQSPVPQAMETISTPYVEKPETISTPVREEPKTTFIINQVRNMDGQGSAQTSSNLYNKLREIDARNAQTRIARPYNPADDLKLSDDDLIAWPMSAEEEAKLRKRRGKLHFRSPIDYDSSFSFGKFFKKAAIVAAALVISSGAAYYLAKSKNNYTSAPGFTAADVRTNAIPADITTNQSPFITGQSSPILESTPQTQNPASIPAPKFYIDSPEHKAIPILTEAEKRQANLEAIELAKARVRAAIAARDAEKAARQPKSAVPQSTSTLENKLSSPALIDRPQVQQEQQQIKNTNKTSNYYSPEAVRRHLQDYWGKRSDERKKREGLVTVKEVTYFPNGDILTTYPNSESHVAMK